MAISYGDNYASSSAVAAAAPTPTQSAPDAVTGQLWLRGKVVYDQGWYRLQDGELIESSTSAFDKQTRLGYVSGAVVRTSQLRPTPW